MIKWVNLKCTFLSMFVITLANTTDLFAQFKGGFGRGDSEAQLWQPYGDIDIRWIKPAYPNPTSGLLKIPLKVVVDNFDVIAVIYSIDGHKIVSIDPGSIELGEYILTLDLGQLSLSSGTYIVHFYINDVKQHLKFTYLKS